MSERDAMSNTCWTKQYEDALEKERHMRNNYYSVAGSGSGAGVVLERKEGNLGTTQNF